ncbi:uncharacterized protein LOC125232328 [Leguminivora glycinivorella]|uniref:uncharacterized protein LOC125232328 n=1 Tax=Leguminivora glycinivorella TaxID=1035111 RepID=UPI00200E150E|nr:uncharacterized protein LOC125232328 [Leguminivora glycinivorella]
MENSFFEYRDQSGVEVESDSDTDVVEESVLEDLIPKTPMKTPMRNNHTVVPDSEESLVYDGSEDEQDTPQAPKTIRKSIAEVIASSDDEEVSPELIPKRRPPIRPKSLNTTTDSPVIRRVKKRMVLLDSDTDNSIIIEKDGKSKMKCLKDTPLKLDGGKDGKVNDSEESDESMDEDEEIFDKGKDESDYDARSKKIGKTMDSDESDSSHYDEAMDGQGKDDNDDDSESDEGTKVVEESGDGVHNDDDDDDGLNEDLMVMSRATRMSIMGIIPKQNDSDESDFIESDESAKRSMRGSTESLTDLPVDAASSRIPLAESTRRATEMNLSPLREGSDSDSDLPEVNITTRTPHKLKTPKPLTPVKTLEDSDDSVLTCSPIQSPLRDVTADFQNSPKTKKNAALENLKDKVLKNISNDHKTYYDGEVTVVNEKPKSKTAKNSYYNGEVTVVEEAGKGTELLEGKENVCDDDVAVIESVPEVIMLSSDEEDELSAPKVALKTSPKTKISPKPKPEKRDNTIKQYLPPPSYPNQVIYVPKHVLDNELSKLNGMQADLHNIRNLLDNMDVTTLPDGGSKLITRLTELEAAVRRQGDRVRNMVVESSQPTPADIARDGYDQGLTWDDLPAGTISGHARETRLTWDDLQKASNAVQPRMFGKQARDYDQGLTWDDLQKASNAVQPRMFGKQVDIARDGYDQGLTWDDLQKASNAVQPRMFGKQVDIARDGYDQGLTWDDLQKASNAVQPRMFGKQVDIARDGYDQGLTWDDLQKASNAVQPRMFGKQGE